MGVEGIKKGKQVVGALSVGGVDFPTSVSFTIASGGTSECDVTIALTDKDGGAITGTQEIDFYVSDSATGAGIVSAGGTLVFTSGFAFAEHTANFAYTAVTDASGEVGVTITDAGASEYYICAIPQSTGKVVVSRQLTADDYGA